MAMAYAPGTEPPMYGHYNGGTETGTGPGPGSHIPQSQPPIAFAYPASSTQYHHPS